MVDWTQVLVAVATYGLPPLVTYGAGLLHMWLRMRHDAEIGRSLRPRPSSDPPTNPRHKRPSREWPPHS